MTIEQNKAVVRRFWKAFETNDQAALNELLAPELVAHTPSSPDAQNSAIHLQGIAMFNAAFSEREFTVEEIVAEGDLVATRTIMRGVHSGEWQGHPATGKRMEAVGLTIERVKDGSIVRRWFSFDVPGVIQALGLIPADN